MILWLFVASSTPPVLVALIRSALLLHPSAAASQRAAGPGLRAPRRGRQPDTPTGAAFTFSCHDPNDPNGFVVTVERQTGVQDWDDVELAEQRREKGLAEDETGGWWG